MQILFQVMRIVESLGSRAKKEMAKVLEGRDVVITSDLGTVTHVTKGFLVVSASFFGRHI